MAKQGTSQQATVISDFCTCGNGGSSSAQVSLSRQNRFKKYQERSSFRMRLKDENKTGLQLLISSIDWLNLTILSIVPAISLYTAFYIPCTWQIALWAFVYYHMTGFGITGGYHRCFAHRSFKTTLPLKFLFVMFGAGAMEGSAKWWCQGHRAHHRYTDTEKDPYNALRGFFYAHIGWLLLKQDHDRIGRVNLDDLRSDPLIKFQHDYYVPIAILMAFIFPGFVSWYLWNNFWGGFFWAGFFRLNIVQHSTFCVNSLAHFWGESSFDDVLSPRDSVLTAVMTLGEGYHNFHHEFPNDYRNAITWWQYDPTKWLINILWFTGLAYDLRCFSNNEVQKGRLDMQQRKLNAQKARLKWGKLPSELPLWSMEKVQQTIQDHPGKILIVINSIVHDVTNFLPEHPGGKGLLKIYNGKDATEEFDGVVYNHTNAARNFLSLLRIARTK